MNWWLIAAGAWLLGAAFVYGVVAGAAKIERRSRDAEPDEEVTP